MPCQGLLLGSAKGRHREEPKWLEEGEESCSFSSAPAPISDAPVVALHSAVAAGPTCSELAHHAPSGPPAPQSSESQPHRPFLQEPGLYNPQVFTFVPPALVAEHLFMSLFAVSIFFGSVC